MDFIGEEQMIENQRAETPVILGLDIGGTKTAAVLGTLSGEVLGRVEVPTLAGEPFEAAFKRIAAAAGHLLAEADARGVPRPMAISVAVGGPLDIERGIIYSPPHLPTWDNAPLKERLEAHFRVPVRVEHDGNAGALAEFYFGAGQGVRSLIYLTMGTGLGAGIILNGQVVRGVTDTAGEVGHIRISEQGPLEYGKEGSWESFCSAAGLVKLARLHDPQAWSPEITAQEIIRRALTGEAGALRLIEEMGAWLGKGLAILVDILNPEVIVVGTLGVVLGDLLLAPAREILRREALPVAAQACRVTPAQLGRELSSVSSLMAVIEACRSGRLVLSGSPHHSRVLDSLSSGLEVRRRTIESLAPQILQTAELLVAVLQNGGKVLACGNGGSAATAQHLVGELVGRYKAERVPLPAVTLSADTSVLTCIGNDYSFEDIFARQVRALAQPGDLLIGYSTSGRSPNVLRALKQAREMGVHTVALTGSKGLAEPVGDYVLAVPSPVTARVQEEHDAILHAWCEVIDASFLNGEVG